MTILKILVRCSSEFRLPYEMTPPVITSQDIILSQDIMTLPVTSYQCIVTLGSRILLRYCDSLWYNLTPLNMSARIKPFKTHKGSYSSRVDFSWPRISQEFDFCRICNFSGVLTDTSIAYFSMSVCVSVTTFLGNG